MTWLGAWAVAKQSTSLLLYAITYTMGAYLVFRIPTLLGLPPLKVEIARGLQAQL